MLQKWNVFALFHVEYRASMQEPLNTAQLCFELAYSQAIGLRIPAFTANMVMIEAQCDLWQKLHCDPGTSQAH